MPDYVRIAVGATRAALSVMRDAPREPHLVDKVVDAIHRLAHSVNDQLQREGDPRRVHLPVCAAGCGWCCHTDVLVSPPELLHIARHLRATRTKEELDLLHAKLRELAARTTETLEGDWKRAKIPCPFLDGATSSCTIYDVRPGPCRAYNSLSLPKCLELYDTGADGVEIPCNGVQQKSILAVGIGLAAACRAHDLEWEGVSLTAGLAAILDQEDAASRWLAGERPFERAHNKMSRNSGVYRQRDIDTALRGMQEHKDELPEKKQDDDAARRERNRKKRLRKGR
jgi:Fe-S-cluster containining protein